MLPAYLCQTELLLMLNWIIWNGIVSDIEIVFTLNWII